MLFGDDIKKGDAVYIRDGTGQIAVQAIDQIKEHDGIRVIAWTAADGSLITERNFLGFVGD